MADDDDFSQVGPRKLSFKYTRRELFSKLWQSVLISRGESEGKGAFTLADLGEWSDSELAGLVPVVVEGCQITVQDGMVVAQSSSTAAPIPLFPQDSTAVTAFNFFNGYNSIQEASTELAAALGWDFEQAFAVTRGLFLFLIEVRVCQPKY